MGRSEVGAPFLSSTESLIIQVEVFLRSHLSGGGGLQPQNEQARDSDPDKM